MQQQDAATLGGFFDWLYGGETGYVYLASKVPGNQHQFQQKFFEWPLQRQELVDHVQSYTPEWEVYMAPALFNSPSSKKADVKGAQVVWVEFDGNTPTELTTLPPPTCRIQSSLEGHEHWYWKLDEWLGPAELETINRAMTYMLGADSSGWDASQILRPPSTFNHKRQRQVHVLEWFKDGAVPVGLFDGLPQPPPPVEQPVPEKIPGVQDVVAKYQFTENVWTLFKNGAPMGQRSSGLMALGYYCAEMNMTNEEMLAVILNADERWGKFQGRQDRMQRLLEIVTRARQKYPFRSSGSAPVVAPRLEPLGFLTLLRTEVNLEWAWEGFLQKAGYFLLTGPSGVGKTQFSLDAAGHFANGKMFLDRPVPHPLRIGFFSLEMGLVDLKHFLSQLCPAFTQDEQEQMEENLKFFALGEPIYLNRPEEKKMIEEVVGDLQLDGIMIDSLGSTTEGELSNESDTKNLMDWNDRLRQSLGCFSWYIHHHRKATGENRKPNKLADIFGSQYITARATTVSTLWPTTSPSQLEYLPLKVRLSAKPEPFQISRDANLHFTRMVPGIAAPVASSQEVETDTPTEQPEPADQSDPHKSAGFDI